MNGRTASLLVAATALVQAFLSSTSQVVSPARERVVLTLPGGHRFSNAGRHLVALSPDGARLVYAANGRLYLRALGQPEGVPIPGTDGAGQSSARSPFLSPDGRWIGFWQDGQLKKVPVVGGEAIALCPAQNPWGASWTDDNTILYGQGPAGIYRVSGDGGTPVNIIKAEDRQIAHGPQLLPGGRAVLFTMARTDNDWDSAQIVVQSLDTGTRRVVVNGASDARYVASGHLVYATGNELQAVPFDIATLSVTGKPVTIVDEVARADVTGAAHFGVSVKGLLVYVPADVLNELRARTLVWVDRQGQEEPIKAPARPYNDPRLSPDGTRVALELQDQERDIWILELSSGTLTRIGSTVPIPPQTRVI